MIDAIQILSTLSGQGIDFKQDFHTLNSSQVVALLGEAEKAGYRKPKNANGSRARYFYAAVQRKLSKKGSAT